MHRLALLSMCSLLACCSGGDPGTGGPASGGNTTTKAPVAALGVAFALPRLVIAGAQSSRSMVAEGVYFATAQTGAALAGQVTRTGTITLAPAGASYAPEPTDKLVVRGLDQVHEFESIDAAGNNQADTPITWLQSPHRLAYVHRLLGKAEVRIEEQFDGLNFTASLRGWALLGDQRYELDLAARGATQGDSGLDGSESQMRYGVTGTVHGGSAEIDVQEQHFVNYASAVSLRLLYSQRGWASQVRAGIANTLRVGGAEWRFTDVQIETGAKEKGGQRTDDVVSCTGSVARDGKPFGILSLQNGIACVAADDGTFPLQVSLGK